MRHALAPRLQERGTFQGTVARFGTRRGWQGRALTTMLLTNIQDADGQPICDHLWFTLSMGFAKMGLAPGDAVQFDARVTLYAKGYYGRRLEVHAPIALDYKLSWPTNIKKLRRQAACA